MRALLRANLQLLRMPVGFMVRLDDAEGSPRNGRFPRSLGTAIAIGSACQERSAVVSASVMSARRALWVILVTWEGSYSITLTASPCLPNSAMTHGRLKPRRNCGSYNYPWKRQVVRSSLIEKRC